jgi:hypothetical protein
MVERAHAGGGDRSLERAYAATVEIMNWPLKLRSITDVRFRVGAPAHRAKLGRRLAALRRARALGLGT